MSMQQQQNFKIYEAKTDRTKGRNRQIHKHSWKILNTFIVMDRKKTTRKISKAVEDLKNIINTIT